MLNKLTGCCGNCNQGRRTCDCQPHAYRTHFNHLGEPINQEPPFLLTDLIIAIAVVGTAVLVAGVI